MCSPILPQNVLLKLFYSVWTLGCLKPDSAIHVLLIELSLQLQNGNIMLSFERSDWYHSYYSLNDSNMKENVVFGSQFHKIVHKGPFDNGLPYVQVILITLTIDDHSTDKCKRFFQWLDYTICLGCQLILLLAGTGPVI